MIPLELAIGGLIFVLIVGLWAINSVYKTGLQNGFEGGVLHERKRAGGKWYVFDDKLGTWFEEKESQ